MASVPLYNLGAAGVIRDTPPHLLPPEAWSDAQNVRFVNRLARKMRGHGQVFGDPDVVPYWAMPVGGATSVLWAYSDLEKVYATDGSTHADITRVSGGDYSGTPEQLWNGGILSGLAIITNDADVPQLWVPGLGTPLVDLPNWPSTWRCKAIKPFKNFLVALNLTINGDEFPHRIAWSHPADPGAVPSSWDGTDETLDAGDRDLSDSEAGVILDGYPMRDLFMIYKERSVWGMQYIGGTQIFRTYPLFDGGILSKACVAPFKNNTRHFVVSGDDIIVHNGQEAESIADKRLREFMQANIDTTHYRRSFCVADPANREVMFAFPEVGAQWPTLAIVWNTIDNTFTFRELPGGVAHMAAGPVPGGAGSVTWDSDSDSWDSDTTQWNTQTFNGYQIKLVQANHVDEQLQQLDYTEQFNGVNMIARLERTGLAYDGKDRQGNPVASYGGRRLWKRIWPMIEGGEVEISIGTQEFLGDPVVWGASQTFNPATQKYLDITVGGRWHAIRIESSGMATWNLRGYQVEVEPLGDQ